jgi:aspartate-semialdehyde dehydrogenase
LLLADLLRPLQAALGVRQATAVVLRPAGDFGRAGLDELRDQTVRILSFAAPPKEVFGRQLAFNVLPQPAEEETRAEADVARLLGWDAPRLAVAMLAVPVFYGHTVLLRVQAERPAGAADAVAALAGAEGIRVPSATTAQTPLDAAEERRIDVARVREDGAGGLWLSAVAGDADAAAAGHALRIAAAIADL